MSVRMVWIHLSVIRVRLKIVNKRSASRDNYDQVLKKIINSKIFSLKKVSLLKIMYFFCVRFYSLSVLPHKKLLKHATHEENAGLLCLPNPYHYGL